MLTYEFTLILQGSLELTEDTAERLLEAGCDDGSPGSCGGVLSIDFHRADGSLEAAIGSAIRDVRSAGFEVERIEMSAQALPIFA